MTTKHDPAGRTSTRALFQRLWRDWVWQHRILFVPVFIFMAIVSATSGAYPMLIRLVFNALDSGGDGSTDVLWQVPLLIMIVSVVRGLGLFGVAKGVAVLVLRVTTTLQKAMTKHLIQADLVMVTSESVGVLMSRITNDINLIREATIRLANNLIRDMLTMAVLVSVMLWLDWILTLVVLGLYPLAMRPLVTIGKRQRRTARDLQQQMGESLALLNETLKGSRMVRAYGLQEYESNRTARMFDWLYQHYLKLALGRARVDPVLEILGGFAIAGIVGLAAWRVLSGYVEIGNVAGFITSLLMMTRPVRALGTLNTVVQEAAAALIRVFSLIDSKPKVTSPPKPTRLGRVKGGIRFDKVSFNYGDIAVIGDIDFDIKPGETVALVGPSGGGKTTLLNLIPRLYDPSRGVIRLDGVDLRQLDLAELRNSIALVSQDSILFDDSIATNISFGRLHATRDDIITAAKAAAAHDFIMELPKGYDTLVGEEGSRLSGGQRQRVAIARAMLRDAPILLLDEPTSALDANTEAQIQATLKTFAAGRTTIIVAHRLITTRHANRIMVIHHGRIVEQGSHDKLISNGGIYAGLCAAQQLL